MEPMPAWGLMQHDPKLGESRLVGVYLHAKDANIDALALQNGDNWVTVEPFEVQTGTLYTSTEPATEESSADFDTPIHVDGEVR